MQQYTCEIIVNDEFEPVLRVSLNAHHSLFVVGVYLLFYWL